MESAAGSSQGSVSQRRLQRAEGLWFKDCGLVIRTADVVFRVSGEILAAKSPIFRDMLQMPQPANAEKFENCPVVHLPDDPIDTTFFLRAIFDSEFFEPYPSRTDFETLYGVLKLSNKYIVEFLRRRALVHISSCYPTTLDGWITPTPSSWTLGSGQIIPLINLAREASALWILPAVFYSFCASTPENFRALARGVIFRNRTVRLKPADLELFLEGSHAQRESASTMLLFLWTPQHIRGCTSYLQCNSARSLERCYRDGQQYTLGYSPLEIWNESDWTALKGHACGTCIDGMRELHRQALQGFWDSLPEKYGLPCWADLEQMKETALM